MRRRAWKEQRLELGVIERGRQRLAETGGALDANTQ
jgi:hypothetical protein